MRSMALYESCPGQSPLSAPPSPYSFKHTPPMNSHKSNASGFKPFAKEKGEYSFRFLRSSGWLFIPPFDPMATLASAHMKKSKIPAVLKNLIKCKPGGPEESVQLISGLYSLHLLNPVHCRGHSGCLVGMQGV